ncbi:pimeloyl-ACP methyl ester carboxylesterase [Chromobacterium alkanivorans]|uniref:alpha/beta fold hydrolase n=1 Tax=Chromobacterium alkanivorans TaxID=1071719 RepID=UPI002168FAD6|nr:pimeloyl-ACP methyl ester carboxylesterase [Chromobacterium alkanivorans]MCS3818706.1 pimeloyl-ACP methyl ester carboxylesterase [Chromobacterium alkanivorans]MCS3876148.1 pimeloyl-ACP methyl ester carboxylesterase [Chromobacterium alkanivorans]
MKSAPPAAQDRMTPLDGGEVFSRLWPAAAPAAPLILLFHDSLGCVELWRDFPAQLRAASGCAVLAYDRLGHGRSSPRAQWPELDFIRREALLLTELLAGWNIGRFIAFGHSVGGAIAAHCAALRPAACQALITESAQAFVEERTLGGIRAAQQQLSRPEQREKLRRYHGDKADWVLNAWVRTWLAPGFAGWNLAAELPALHCPLLAIHGEEDEYGSALHPRRYLSLSRAAAELLLLPGVRHLPHREQPELVAGAVAGFLRRRLG